MRRPSRPTLFSLAAALAVAAGCQSQTYTTRAPVDQEPLVVDEAMQQRQWDPVKAQYENGGTYSGSTGFAYGPDHSVPPYLYSATDTFTFLGNVLTFPYTYYQQRHGVVSGGVVLPPSYTANPPMPPSTQPE